LVDNNVAGKAGSRNRAVVLLVAVSVAISSRCASVTRSSILAIVLCSTVRFAIAVTGSCSSVAW
jgi:hypothetical protein